MAISRDMGVFWKECLSVDVVNCHVVTCLGQVTGLQNLVLLTYDPGLELLEKAINLRGYQNHEEYDWLGFSSNWQQVRISWPESKMLDDSV